MAGNETPHTTALDTHSGMNGNGSGVPTALAADQKPNRNGWARQKTKELPAKSESAQTPPADDEKPPSTQAAQFSRGKTFETPAADRHLTDNQKQSANETQEDLRNLEAEETAAIFLTPEVIASYARSAKIELFQDQHGSVFVWLRVGEGIKQHFECLAIRDRAFLSRLLELVQSRTKSTPNPVAVKQAIQLLEFEAYRTAKRTIDVRRSQEGEEIFIDLGDPNWNMVRVNRQGWTVEKQDTPRFFRLQHMQPLPEPIPGGDLNDLFTYVPTETNEEKLLLIAWMLSAFCVAVPNPMLLLVGQQGSAKTTRSRRLRSLLDPSQMSVLGELEMANLFLTFQHHGVPCFENVSHFSRKEVDMFCRAVTGNAVERRKLYTNSDQVLYSFRKPIIINGIDIPSTRPDFLDRCLILHCRRMEQFTALEELDRHFEATRPRLFGATLDLLVKTLNVLPTISATNEFRMADFARFGRAVAVALGLNANDFDRAYRWNIEQQNYDVLEGSPMTRLLKVFAATYPEAKKWTGTTESLLQELHAVAKSRNDVDGKRDLPKAARWLSSRLSELAPALATIGVFVRKLPRSNTSRLWDVYSGSNEATSRLADAVRQRMHGGANHE